jgi:hypothetical protein
LTFWYEYEKLQYLDRKEYFHVLNEYRICQKKKELNKREEWRARA